MKKRRLLFLDVCKRILVQDYKVFITVRGGDKTVSFYETKTNNWIMRYDQIGDYIYISYTDHRLGYRSIDYI